MFGSKQQHPLDRQIKDIENQLRSLQSGKGLERSQAGFSGLYRNMQINYLTGKLRRLQTQRRAS